MRIKITTVMNLRIFYESTLLQIIVVSDSQMMSREFDLICVKYYDHNQLSHDLKSGFAEEFDEIDEFPLLLLASRKNGIFVIVSLEIDPEGSSSATSFRATSSKSAYGSKL